MTDDLRYYYSALAQVAGTLAGVSALAFTFARQRLGSREWNSVFAFWSGVIGFGATTLAAGAVLFLGASPTAVVLSRALLSASFAPLVVLLTLRVVVVLKARRSQDQELSPAVGGRDRLRRIKARFITRRHEPVVIAGLALAIVGATVIGIGQGNRLDARDLVLSILPIGMGLLVVARSITEAGKPSELKVQLVRRTASNDAGWDIAVLLKCGDRPVDNWSVILFGLPNRYQVTHLYPGAVPISQPSSYQFHSNTMGPLDVQAEILLMTFEPVGEPVAGNFRFAVSGRDVVMSRGEKSILHVKPIG